MNKAFPFIGVMEKFMRALLKSEMITPKVEEQTVDDYERGGHVLVRARRLP